MLGLLRCRQRLRAAKLLGVVSMPNKAFKQTGFARRLT